MVEGFTAGAGCLKRNGQLFLGLCLPNELTEAARPQLELERAFVLGACGGVEAPNWDACDPGCANAILDPTQLAFLKDAAGPVPLLPR